MGFCSHVRASFETKSAFAVQQTKPRAALSRSEASDVATVQFVGGGPPAKKCTAGRLLGVRQSLPAQSPEPSLGGDAGVENDVSDRQGRVGDARRNLESAFAGQRRRFIFAFAEVRSFASSSSNVSTKTCKGAERWARLG
jgi:hypothetical protein